jgi:hypothetical protein
LFCAKCGSQLPENSKFCSNCGTSASPAGAAEEIAEPNYAPGYTPGFMPPAANGYMQPQPQPYQQQPQQWQQPQQQDWYPQEQDGYGYQQHGQGFAHQQLYAPKSIGLCILFSFITFGIYGLYWLYTLCKNIKLLNGEPPSCGGEFCLNIFVPIYGYYWIYTRSKKLSGAAWRRGIPTSDNSTLYLVLAILGLSLVSYALIQNDLNTAARGNGR